MITALSHLPLPNLVRPAPNNAAGVALRALLTPGALAATTAGSEDFAATWAEASEARTAASAPPNPAAPAREASASNNNVSGLAQLLRDIALVTRASAATDKLAANDATHSARADVGEVAPAETNAMAQAPAPPPEKADAAASTTPHHMIWSAQAWPGQRAEFQITHWPREQRSAGQTQDERDEWRTCVRVDLPRLGKLEAAVGLSAAGLRIALKAEASSTLALLESGRAELHGVLADAGLNPVGLHISRMAL